MQKHNTSKMLGNPVACDDSNPEFLLSFAACLDRTMIDLPKVLTYKQTSHALVTTLKATSYLLPELLNE